MATTDYNRTKRCKVFRNGDSLFLGKDVVINRRKIRNLDTLLTNVTVECKTSNAVRRLVTPVGGTEIHDLDEIQDNATLVAVSNGPFKKLQYNNLDAKIFPVNRQSPRVHVMDIQPVVHSELYRKHSGRARKIPTGALTIFVYANNHEFEPARRLTYRLIHLRALHWNQILDQIAEKLELLTSCKRLYKMPHQGSQGDTDTWEKITDIQQLEQGKYYVAVGAEGGGLRKLDYGQKRNFYISPKLERRLSYSAYRENRKYYSALFANRMPNKAVSENYVKPKIDVTTTSEPTMKRQNDTTSYQTNRKSRASDHSTSTAAGSEHPREHVKDRSPMRGSKTSTQSKSSDHSDVYHAKQKPVKHQRNMDKVVDLDKDDSGIYKAKGSRTETQGAEEVQETKDTKVDLPIDKREAEPVTDEELEVFESPSEKTDQGENVKSEIKLNRKKNRDSLSIGDDSSQTLRLNDVESKPSGMIRASEPVTLVDHPDLSVAEKRKLKSRLSEVSGKTEYLNEQIREVIGTGQIEDEKKGNNIVKSDSEAVTEEEISVTVIENSLPKVDVDHVSRLTISGSTEGQLLGVETETANSETVDGENTDSGDTKASDSEPSSRKLSMKKYLNIGSAIMTPMSDPAMEIKVSVLERTSIISSITESANSSSTQPVTSKEASDLSEFRTTSSSSSETLRKTSKDVGSSTEQTEESMEDRLIPQTEVNRGISQTNNSNNQQSEKVAENVDTSGSVPSPRVSNSPAHSNTGSVPTLGISNSPPNANSNNNSSASKTYRKSDKDVNWFMYSNMLEGQS